MNPSKPSVAPESLPPTNPANLLIEIRQVDEVYETAAGDFPALRGFNAQVYSEEFLNVTSNSGLASTL